MAAPAAENTQVWFRDNDTYVAMRRWASWFTGLAAGELTMHDVRLAVISSYPGGLETFMDDLDWGEIQ